MRYKPLFVVLLLLLCGVAAAWGWWRLRRGSPRPELPTGGTRAMARRLEEMVERWERKPFPPEEEERLLFQANHPHWIPLYRERLEKSRDPREIVMFRHKLARELLRAGRTTGALREFEWLYEVIGRSNLAARVKRQLLEAIERDVAIALLRRGEEENCLAMHGPDSCIFPLQGGGVHRKQDGARAAVAVLSSRLRSDPSDLGSRWLLNLAYMALGAHPDGVPRSWLIPQSVFRSDSEMPRFRDVAARRGVDASGLAGGCCVEDFDGDGDLDIVASSWGLRHPLRYFEQQSDGSFLDRTEAAGLTGEIGGLNLSHADYDNDGRPDVFVLRGGWLGNDGAYPNSLLRNVGGAFDDVTAEAGLLTFHPTQTAAWADFDGDGWLDLFVGNEQEEGADHPSELFHNDGDGTFSDWARPSGLADLGYVKGCAWGDYDNDGYPDLYVSRMHAPNRLYRNARAPARTTVPEGESSVPGWKFVDVTERAGVGEPIHSFPTWFWDYDNDGWLDVFAGGFDGASLGEVVGEYLGSPHPQGHPRLYRNEGDGTFRDVTQEVRLDRVQLAMGAGFGDLEGDGWPDIYIGNGAPSLRMLIPNRMFRNARGEFFSDVTTSGGFGHLQKGHGIAFADIDADGDQDIYAVMGGWYTGDGFPNALFENPGNRNRWLTLRLEGRRSNRAAFGARVRITVRTAEGTRHIHATVGTGGSFGSGSIQQEIGLGRALSVEQVEIRWPAPGGLQVLRDVGMDRVIAVTEPDRG